MEHYEMAELLSRKANVSLEEARSVLCETDWDILDAMIELERRRGKKPEPVVIDRTGDGEAYSEPQPVRSAPKKEPVITNGFAQLWHYTKRALHLSVQTEFTIIRRDRVVLSVPVLVLVILLVFCFWCILPALVIGMFFGFRYRFEGKHGAEAANRAMDKLDNVVENIKDSLNDSDEG